MNQISALEADAMLGKLLSERIPVRASFKSSSGAEAVIVGFIDARVSEHRIIVSASGPPVNVDKGLIRSPAFDRACLIWYGETRELKAEERESVFSTFGDSLLIFDFSEFNERLSLFFTIPL